MPPRSLGHLVSVRVDPCLGGNWAPVLDVGEGGVRGQSRHFDRAAERLDLRIERREALPRKPQEVSSVRVMSIASTFCGTHARKHEAPPRRLPHTRRVQPYRQAE